MPLVVVVNVAGLWLVTPSYVCCTEATEASFTAAEPLISDDNEASMNVALLVVVPIFLALYCGSCVAYMIYKIYRNCFRSHNKSPGVNLDGVNLDGIEATAPAERRPPPTFPTYLHAAVQPPRSTAVRGGASSYVKSPPRYENETGVAVDTGPQLDHSDDVPITCLLYTSDAADE